MANARHGTHQVSHTRDPDFQHGSRLYPKRLSTLSSGSWRCDQCARNFSLRVHRTSVAVVAMPGHRDC
uniref:C2H2-type domain-containing protein n=1 Tax=Physcomitrium patens TaxID=3218 RepID=A0A2K1IHL4_PHYPA|nr:hypothetical protein PHYPA_029343 [Physcomitrium patens]